MRLSRGDIDELKTIYQERFNQELSDDEAWEMGRRLMRLFTVLLSKPPSWQVGSSMSSNPVQLDQR